jgi:ligand-binding sensor domain-containing protein
VGDGGDERVRQGRVRRRNLKIARPVVNVRTQIGRRRDNQRQRPGPPSRCQPIGKRRHRPNLFDHLARALGDELKRLAHRAVLSLALDKQSGDLWVGTMGGLSHVSAGRIDTFNQLNSGLSNDVVYGVTVQEDYVWAATAAGASRLNTRTGQWSLFNERNTPMYEIWTYNVTAGPDKVYLAVWGGGVLEYDLKTERWKDYNDPDGETEIVLFKDQGLIHEITTSVSYVDKILWVATYFGDSRYDGRHWHNFLTKDSGLPSNFTNQVRAIDAERAWFSTDKGLAFYDGTNWAVYRPALDSRKPEMYVRDEEGHITNLPVDTAPAHNYVLGVDFQGDDLWVATAKGLSHGIRQK